MKRLLLGLWLATGAQGAEKMAPFVLPWDDGTAGPTDLSMTLPKPAGSQGYVEVRDGQLYHGNQRLKLFGVNLTAGACYPDHDNAAKSAARLAKFGVNAVRIHFLDATWGQPRLINYDSGNWQNWNMEALDRFDFWMAKLKEAGIYLNLNLLVGRRFALHDGVDPTINQLHWKTAHAMGFFDEAHLRTQQAYARALLSHVNPYTGLTYADEPAVAMVEVINENGLIHSWMSREFEPLPPPFATQLRRRWNEWLRERHGTTETLATAWGARHVAPGEELLSSRLPNPAASTWYLETHEGAVAENRVSEGAAEVAVQRLGKASWHIQMHHANLKVRREGLYTLTLRAAADRQRTIYISLMQATEPWQQIGFGQELTLTPQMQSYTFTIRSDRDCDNARINLGALNQSDATFRFADLSFREGGRFGLQDGESLEKGTVEILHAKNQTKEPAAKLREWIDFLHQTEGRYWQAMRDFLRQELGVKALLVGTTQFTSTPHLQAGFDIIDTHAYWQHPRFPGKEWDPDNWLIDNRSMVDKPGDATLIYLARQRVAGKPFMVSEYNHPAPNFYAGEAPLFLAAIGAQQDWDAIFLYNYSSVTAERQPGMIPDFFDIAQHPTIMANLPVASLLFRRDIRASSDRWPDKLVSLTNKAELELIDRGGRSWQVVPYHQLGVDWRAMMQSRLKLELHGEVPDSDAVITHPRSVFELSWQETAAAGGGVFMSRTKDSALYVGRLDGQVLELIDKIGIKMGVTRRQWCSVALTRLPSNGDTEGCQRYLLVLGGIVENSQMEWRDKNHSTVGRKWGQAPTLVEQISAQVTLPGQRQPRVTALDGHGQALAVLEPTDSGKEQWQVQLGQQPTLWYELYLP